jgi:hypothetical protein
MLRDVLSALAQTGASGVEVAVARHPGALGVSVVKHHPKGVGEMVAAEVRLFHCGRRGNRVLLWVLGVKRGNAASSESGECQNGFHYELAMYKRVGKRE